MSADLRASALAFIAGMGAAALLEEDDEPMTRRRAVIIGALLATCLLSAVWLDGREARARCAEGVDTVASCQGVLR